MVTFAQMKRRDIRVMYRILSILAIPLKVPFYILLVVGGCSEIIIDIINHIGIAPIKWYIKIRRIDKSGSIDRR